MTDQCTATLIERLRANHRGLHEVLERIWMERRQTGHGPSTCAMLDLDEQVRLLDGELNRAEQGLPVVEGR